MLNYVANSFILGMCAFIMRTKTKTTLSFAMCSHNALRVEAVAAEEGQMIAQDQDDMVTVTTIYLGLHNEYHEVMAIGYDSMRLLIHYHTCAHQSTCS